MHEPVVKQRLQNMNTPGQGCPESAEGSKEKYLEELEKVLTPENKETKSEKVFSRSEASFRGVMFF